MKPSVQLNDVVTTWLLITWVIRKQDGLPHKQSSNYFAWGQSHQITTLDPMPLDQVLVHAQCYDLVATNLVIFCLYMIQWRHRKRIKCSVNFECIIG